MFLQAGDEERREPDDEIVAELVLIRHRCCDAADVQAAERARPVAQCQPPVDAVPVERVAARQPPYVLPVTEPRYAHAASTGVVVDVVATAANHAAGAGESSGEERHHVPHRRHHLCISLNQNRDADIYVCAGAGARICCEWISVQDGMRWLLYKASVCAWNHFLWVLHGMISKGGDGEGAPKNSSAVRLPFRGYKACAMRKLTN